MNIFLWIPLLGIRPNTIKFNANTNNYLSGLWTAALLTPVCDTDINTAT